MGGKKKNRIRQSLRKFGAVRNWQLLLILVPLLFVAATLLRFDHIRMVELRSAVMQADQENNDEARKAALIELRNFTFSHIVVNVTEQNGRQRIIFGTGPFYLEQQYLSAAEAAIKAAEEELKNSDAPESNAYAEAMAACRPQAIANGWSLRSAPYYECLNQELAKNPSSGLLDNQLTASVPSTELFRYNYASPVWAPTWAGWVILLCVIIFAIIVIRIIIWCVLRVALFFIDKH